MSSELDKNIFGLDVSDGALRLIQIKKTGKKLIISSYNEIKVPAGVINQGLILQEEKFINLLKQLVKTAKGRKITTKNLVAALPETRTFIKVIEIGQAKEEKEIPRLVEEEIKNHIPLNPEEIYLDWQILKQKSDSIKLLVGAAPKNIADTYAAALEKSGFIPQVLEIEAAAITRSLVPKNDDQAKIIVDFGASRSGLIVYDQKTPQFTVSLQISGNKITQTIAETLKLDLIKAEKAKIVCGLNAEKCEGALLKILMAPIDELAKQIKKAILFYKTNFSESNQISEIILSGGGANFSKIEKVLTEKLNLPVKIADPFVNVSPTKKDEIPASKILSYSTAIGLALRAWQKKN